MEQAEEDLELHYQSLRSRLLKYFLHGIAFAAINLFMALVWVLILFFLIGIGSLLGAVVGFVVYFFFLGGINTFLMVVIWSAEVDFRWKTLLKHGFVLFFVLLIPGIPTFVIVTYLPNIWIYIVVFILSCFFNGFLSKTVGDRMEGTREETDLEYSEDSE